MESLISLPFSSPARNPDLHPYRTAEIDHLSGLGENGKMAK
ncbi:hypothetical protein [Thermosulfurimonas marina]|nr:hypothetical protein [Thermosulfurimonas marina]